MGLPKGYRFSDESRRRMAEAAIKRERRKRLELEMLSPEPSRPKERIKTKKETRNRTTALLLTSKGLTKLKKAYASDKLVVYQEVR